MIFLNFLLNLLLFKFGKRAICVKKDLSFAQGLSRPKKGLQLFCQFD